MNVGTWSKTNWFGSQSQSVVDLSGFFDFASIGDCLVWLDPADPGAVTLSSCSITQIADKSGNGNNGIQVSSSLQPRYEPAVRNGYNAMCCNRNGSSFTTLHGLEMTAVIPQPFTVAWAGQRVITSTAAAWFGISTGVTVIVAAFESASVHRFSMFAGTADYFYATGNSCWNVHLLEFNNSSSVGYLNGVAGAPGSPGSAGLTNPWKVGFAIANTSPDFMGDFIVYNGLLSSADRNTVITELGAKWGVTI